MSKEMAEQKRKEIEEMEKLAEKEAKQLESLKEDKCPACGTATTNLGYINPGIVKMFGWVECNVCGCVYSPMSIRKQKQQMAVPPK